MFIRHVIFLCLIAMLTFSIGFAARSADSAKADLEQDGWGDLDVRGPVVLLFHSVQCPISDRYVPVIERLQAKHKGVDGLRIYLVFPNKTESDSAVVDYLTSRNLRLPVLRDRAGRLTRRVGAQVTPEVVVLQPGPSGPVLAYRGRYDNRYTELGKGRPQATVHFLDDVLTGIAAGERIEFQDTRAVGCYIVRDSVPKPPTDRASETGQLKGHDH